MRNLARVLVGSLLFVYVMLDQQYLFSGLTTQVIPGNPVSLYEEFPRKVEGDKGWDCRYDIATNNSMRCEL